MVLMSGQGADQPELVHHPDIVSVSNVDSALRSYGQTYKCLNIKIFLPAMSSNLGGKSSLKKNEIIRKVLLVNMEVNNGLMEIMLKLIWF